MTSVSIDLDIWKNVAEKCVHTNRLRTVCDVARDLAKLQCLCKSLSTCASSAWPTLADKLCKKPYRWPEDVNIDSLTTDQLTRYLPADKFLADEVLQLAVKLPPAQLVIFIQIQTDQKATIDAAQAKKEYLLTKDDLKPVGFQAKQIPRNSFARRRLYSKQVMHRHF